MSKMSSSEVDDAVDNTVNYLGRLVFRLLKIAIVIFVLYWVIVYGGLYIWVNVG